MVLTECTGRSPNNSCLARARRLPKRRSEVAILVLITQARIICTGGNQLIGGVPALECSALLVFKNAAEEHRFDCSAQK